MICSGFINNCHSSKIRTRAIRVMMISAVAAALCFCFFAPAAAAEKESSSTSVDSVNLRENKWVYSVCVDKSDSRYASVTRYDGDDIEIEIPASLGGVPVKSVSREAFRDRTYITSVVIPDGVTEIGKYAFSGCIGLRSVAFPASLTAVGEGAFYGCRSLTEAVFPEGTLRIDSFAFYNCVHLQRAEFPQTLRSIGDSSFDNCAALQSVAFGGDLASIGDVAFKGCASLAGVDLPGVSELGAAAFLNCTALEKVVLGDGLTEIRPETFRGCESLRSVTFGAGITKIGRSAFENCVSLREMKRADSIEEIGCLAFRGCVSLQKATFGKPLKKIEKGAFAGCAALSRITVPEENATFATVNGCLFSSDGSELILCPQGYRGNLKLPDGVRNIDSFAASGCEGISEVVFNEGLTGIQEGAFLGCTDIASVSLPDSLETVGSAALGKYIYGGRLQKADYLSVYAAAGGCAEKYCAETELMFTPYAKTLCVSSERVVLAEGKTFRLTCGFLAGKKQDVSWESSDDAVVRVSGGLLTAVSAGSAEVTVSAEGFEARAVRVETVPAGAIGTHGEKTSDTRMLYCGESEELSSLFSQIIDPIFASKRFWFSSSPAVVTVTNDGRVTAHRRGKARVTCRMPDGSENSVAITVTEKPSAFALSLPEKEIITGGSIAAEKTLCPSYSTDTITWKSDDESVAKVDENGIVTAVSQGKCTVTATAASGLESSVGVKCVLPAESISLDRETRNVYQGKQFNLTATLTPEDSMQKITWRSSDPNVASVNSKGKVTGRSFGTAVIYAETSGGVTAECVVNVVTRARELSLDVKKLKINLGEEYKLNAVIRPSYSPETTDRCAWNSTDEKVATVDENGIIHATGVGKCIINCRTGGDLISKCQVQVRLPAESVEITSGKNSIYINETLQLRAEALPRDSTDAIEWSSDNEDIARVTSAGVVTGKSAGTAVITVKFTNDVTGGSVSAEFEITVMKKADSVSLSTTSLSLRVGESDSLSFTVAPDDCNDTVRWYSTDGGVAAVRSDGLITAVAEGSCYICLESGSGALARCKVTVKA